VSARKDHLRDTLAELERLIAKAGRSGATVETWVEQLVVELRAAMPEAARQPGEEVAYRILSDPDASIVAQAQIDPAVLQSLKQLIVSGIR
jgi:hypothetical protein